MAKHLMCIHYGHSCVCQGGGSAHDLFSSSGFIHKDIISPLQDGGLAHDLFASS